MNKIESIQKERKRKVDEIKCKILSLKELMGDEKNVSLVKSQLDVLMQLSDNAAALHESLMLLIPKDEQQKQEPWFLDPLLETHMVERPQQQEASSVEKDAHEGVENGELPQFHQNPQNDDKDDEIAPHDSISNQGSVKNSIRSNVSSTVSARLRADADMAALPVRQKLLNEKHALEQQEDEIRKQKE